MFLKLNWVGGLNTFKQYGNKCAINTFNQFSKQFNTQSLNIISNYYFTNNYCD